MRIAQFIPLTKLPRKLGCFDYQVSSDMAKVLEPGLVIQIPFAKRKVWACFVGFIGKSNFENIKTVENIVILTQLDKFQLEFLFWFSNYHYYSLGSTFTLMQPELPQKIQSKPRVGKIAEPISKPIIFEQNLQTKKIAKEIIEGKDKKYWIADFDASAKWSLYLELIQQSQKQVFVFFSDVVTARRFYDSLPVMIKEQTQLAIGESMKTKNKAYQIWSDIKENKCKLVVGTRSTCFYLHENVDLLIVDSTDSEDFKQWDQAPYYDSVNLLIKAQSILKGKLILTTTKPRIEDAYTFKKEKYQYISLGHKAKLDITISDMGKEQRRKYHFLSFNAEVALAECLEKNKQALLVINKSGMFSKLVCPDCAYEARCEKCDLPMTVNEENELECRHCKIKIKIPSACPQCGNVRLQGRGAGLAQMKKELSVEYRCSEDLSDSKAQILLSTGQYLEKESLENIGAVIFVYFDSLIYLTDFNANYRLYSFVQNIIGTLNQSQPVVIQTYFPENDVFKYLKNDYSSLYKNEILSREEHSYPPFCNLIKLFFQHHDKKICATEAERLFKILEPQIKALGGTLTEPYLYYLNKIRKRFRYILTIKLPTLSLEAENQLLNSIPDFWSIDKSPKDLL
ncbi:MAG: Primosomal protein N` [Parcubacteria group bacterium GW2011_GWC2_38_7]|nr:MAG: Primosomal protein N` [Parcubacteria group bacterium GW2011_GWC2_38_7]